MENCDKNSDKSISWSEARNCSMPIRYGTVFVNSAGEDGELTFDEFMWSCGHRSSFEDMKISDFEKKDSNESTAISAINELKNGLNSVNLHINEKSVSRNNLLNFVFISLVIVVIGY